jgi:hypothetical protein
MCSWNVFVTSANDLRRGCREIRITEVSCSLGKGHGVDRQVKTFTHGLCRASDAWAKTFLLVTGIPDPQLEELLWDEILAYALCLLKLRLGNPPTSEADWLLGEIRNECAVVRAARLRKKTNPQMLLATAVRNATTQFDQHWIGQTYCASASPEVLKDIYGDFCRLTGLEADVLVGGGGNLATIIFYIITFGLMTICQPPSDKKKIWLLRATRECRASLCEVISDFLSTDPELHDWQPKSRKLAPAMLVKRLSLPPTP